MYIIICYLQRLINFYRLQMKKLNVKLVCIDYILNIDLLFYLNISPLSANPIKWSNTLKKFVGNLPTNCLSVFDHVAKLALKGLVSI